MNRNGRTRLAMATRRFASDAATCISAFRDLVADMASTEDEKIENLPGSLADSLKADGLRECRDMLESIITRLDDLEESIEEVAELSDTDLSRGRMSARKTGDNVSSPSDELAAPRDRQLHLLVPTHTADKLRAMASIRGCSVNQIAMEAFCNIH